MAYESFPRLYKNFKGEAATQQGWYPHFLVWALTLRHKASLNVLVTSENFSGGHRASCHNTAETSGPMNFQTFGICYICKIYLYVYTCVPVTGSFEEIYDHRWYNWFFFFLKKKNYSLILLALCLWRSKTLDWSVKALRDPGSSVRAVAAAAPSPWQWRS